MGQIVLFTKCKLGAVAYVHSPKLAEAAIWVSVGFTDPFCQNIEIITVQIINPTVFLQEKHGRPCPWQRSAHTCRRPSVSGSSTPSTIPTTSTGPAGGSSWRRAPSPRAQRRLSPLFAAHTSPCLTTSPTCSRTSSTPSRTVSPALQLASPLCTSATQTLLCSQTQQQQQTLSHTSPPCTQTQLHTMKRLSCTLVLRRDTRSTISLQVPTWSRKSPGFTGAHCAPLGPP